jgi:hypothetical protein
VTWTNNQSDTRADNLATFTFGVSEQVPELKQTSATSGEMLQNAHGHMLHVTVQCLPTYYLDMIRPRIIPFLLVFQQPFRLFRQSRSEA